MATLMEKLRERIGFKVSGLVGDTLKFEDSRTGEITRMIRIEGFGKTFTVDAEDDEELTRFKELNGSLIRASGILGRRRSAAAATAKVTKLILPGDKEWSEPKDDEIVKGGTFNGVGIITERKFSEYRGQTYRSMQLGSIGETFLFRDIDPVIFERIPESGPVTVSGKLDTKVVGTANGLVSDLIFSLEDVKPVLMDEPKPARPAPPGIDLGDKKPA
jgi:hypothetical protein